MNRIPKPQDSYWSDDQWNAISLSGGDMLVAAAAGSGKTAVLVERIIRKLAAADQPLSVDRLLVATFTKAAASEMRQRIREALERELERDPGSEHLSRQLAMLGRASITTLHSFCMEVIQRHYTLIPLDPGFRIASESEAVLLRQEVLEGLFEEKYAEEEEGGDFLTLVDWFSGERSDSEVFVLVQKLYEFSRSQSWPEHWLRQAAAAFRPADLAELEGSGWLSSLLKDALIILDDAADVLRQAEALALSPGGPAPYADTLREDMALIASLQAAASEADGWTGLQERFLGAGFGKLKPCKKDQTDPDLQERVKRLRDDVKKSVTELRGQLFSRSLQDYLEELYLAAPLMEGLAELVIEFGERYKKEKMERGWLDFSDLEHYCLQILRHPDSTPAMTMPSEAAREYQLQYEEVLLDEYQDTNTVQEDIVRLIARQSPGNRFMVGDVKQSIYRFRLAEPGLFLEKYRSYGGDFTGSGLRIDLARNFRSRREVVDAVNLLFRQIMNEGVAEIAYDNRAELVYGEGYENLNEGSDYRPELLLLDRKASASSSSEEAAGDLTNTVSPVSGSNDKSIEENEVEPEAVRLEARAIARRIRELTGQTGLPPLQVYDKQLKRLRPAEYRDMVILLRSTLSWAPIMIEELRIEGIPAYGELNQGYFQASEVETMLSLLQVIDNPLQDIPLAAVLRSPVFGLSEEELAQVRLTLPSGSFYEAVLSAASGDQMDATALDKLKLFLEQLDDWRNLASEGDLGHLIRAIYRDTGLQDWALGLPGGHLRQANLQALHDRAIAYEKATSSRGLFRFLRYLERLRENGGDLGAASASGSLEQAVQIMTIHKSKGLEFPVVFVAGLSKMFNRQDLNARFLIHKELGFGPKLVDSIRRVSYPMLPNLAIRRRALMELLAEEMRVLYVALTRPKDKLILISAVKDLSKTIEGWGSVMDIREEQLPDYLLAGARSYLDWIGPSLIRTPSAVELRRWAGLSETASGVLADTASEWLIRAESGLTEPDSTHAAVDHQEAAATAELADGTAAPSDQPFMPGEHSVLDRLLSDEAPFWLHHVNKEADEQVKAALSWSYPYHEDTMLPAKTTVTELKSYEALNSDESPAVDILTPPPALSAEDSEPSLPEFQLQLRRPRFMEQNRLTPTERGTAYHTLMQHISFEGEETAESLRSLLNQLVERQIMTSEQISGINLEYIIQFRNSPLGMALRQADWIRREMPFSFGLPASRAHRRLHQLQPQGNKELEPNEGEETVLVQGVIDCLFQVDGRVILLDYKSDKVLPHRGGVAALTESYRFQLELYAEALEKITGMPVDEKWLFFFDSGDAVQL
ncbi:helicase-exonuclease AddAB subunit AddA [Paenibacillus antibioticophila]|uniref:helicase-exonuclease AddAB subunit AddA n=1 Tax=Paenibacillus antibioticophila TaxID=1274374 RepID=UPI0005CB3835|nr:helicase-exonuclease AddAB subunit AddA [Paenibacillus antibioticophila]